MSGTSAKRGARGNHGTTWADGDGERPGDVRYLVEAFYSSTGNTRRYVMARPLRTNMSGEPKLHGWCGETNNVSRTACGVVRVVATNRDADRLRVERVEGDELAEFLTQDGYPELIP
jgi:hypothetical protein